MAGREEVTEVALFHHQFRPRGHREGLTSIMRKREKRGLEWTCFVTYFAMGALGVDGSHCERGKGES
jgi:hypothetical protein